MAVGQIQGPTPSIQTQLWPTKYFTGADCSIYFGDVFVDEVVDLEFAMQERVMPLMGYAAHTHHRVARGTRQIQGTFTLNFRSSGYLYSILDHIGRTTDTEFGALPFVARMLNIDKPALPNWVARAHESIEQLLDRVHKPRVIKRTPERWYIPLTLGDGNPTTATTDPNYAQKMDSIHYLKAALVKRGFLQQASADAILFFTQPLLDAIRAFQIAYGINWQGGQFDMTTAQQLTDLEYDRPPDGLDALSRMQEMEQQIWGTGAVPDDEFRYKPYFNSGPFTSKLAQKGFDIYIIFGALDYVSATAGNTPRAASFPNTIRALYGVEVTGVQQVMAPDGHHILERYSFMARDLDINTGGTPTADPGNASAPGVRRTPPQAVVKAPPIPPQAVQATVTRAKDGDTFVLSDGRDVRLIGVNSPELAKNHPGMALDEPKAAEAFTLARNLVEGKNVFILVGEDATDSFGRTLAWIWTADGHFLGYELVRQGLAKKLVIGKNTRYSDAISYAEQAARESKLGVWADNAPGPIVGAKYYVVRFGDTAESIAREVLDDPARWPEIYVLNRDVIGPNPTNVQAGMQLHLP